MQYTLHWDCQGISGRSFVRYTSCLLYIFPLHWDSCLEAVEWSIQPCTQEMELLPLQMNLPKVTRRNTFLIASVSIVLHHGIPRFGTAVPCLYIHHNGTPYYSWVEICSLQEDPFDLQWSEWSSDAMTQWHQLFLFKYLVSTTGDMNKKGKSWIQLNLFIY